MSKSEKEIKMDLDALSDMLLDIKKRVSAYNRLAASSDVSLRVGLLEGNKGDQIDDCGTYFPEANFWYPSSWGC